MGTAAWRSDLATQRQPSGRSVSAVGRAEVDHVYVLVEALRGVVDVLDHDGVGRDDFLGIGEADGGGGSEDADGEAGFFEDFADDGLNGVFVRLYVAAGGKPCLDLGGASGGLRFRRGR